MQKVKKVRILIIGTLLSLLMIGLFVTGIVQTTIYNNITNEIQHLNSEIDKQKEDIKNKENEIDYNNSTEGKEDYFHSNEEVSDGEIIYK